MKNTVATMDSLYRANLTRVAEDADMDKKTLAIILSCEFDEESLYSLIPALEFGEYDALRQLKADLSRLENLLSEIAYKWGKTVDSGEDAPYCGHAWQTRQIGDAVCTVGENQDGPTPHLPIALYDMS